MNWDAIAAVADVVGVVGVIVSIGYLASQVRQGNQVAQDSAFQGVFSLALDNNRGIAEGSNRAIVIKGLVDYGNLEGHEKMTFDLLMLGMVTVIEAALASNDIGLLDDEQPDGFAYYIRTRLLPYGGMRDWWVDAKDIFSPTVQEWVAAQLSKTDIESDFLGIK